MRTPACLIAVVLAAAAQGQTLPTVVYSTFDAGTNSVNVPGIGARTMTSFDGLHASSDGRRFILIANLSGDSTSNRVIIAGSTVSAAGSVIVRKGEAIPNYTTRTVNILDNARINNCGEFIFNTNTGGSGALLLFFLKGVTEPAVSWSYVAASTEAVPGRPGWTFSGGYQSPLLDDTGRWGFQTGINTGAGVQPSIWFGDTLISQANDAAFSPTMLPASSPTTWGSYTLRRVFTNASGTTFHWIGTPPGGTNDICAFNNVAVAEEGAPLPANGMVVATLSSAWLDPSGAWYLRCDLLDGLTAPENTDVVVRNAAIIAQRRQEVIPGSAITWDRVNATSTTNGFQMNVGNALNHYFVAGNALDGTTSLRTAVGVVDGTSMVIKRGDPIDVNGNGMADDNAFLQGFNSETGAGKAFLTDSGHLWMDVNLQDGGGTSLGRAIVRMRLDISAACDADVNRAGGLTVQDIFDFLNAWFAGCGCDGGAACGGINADFNRAGGVGVQDIFDFLNAWFAGC